MTMPTEVDKRESSLYYNVKTPGIKSAKGIYVYDEDGNEYIDCSAATFNLSLGYGHPAVIEAIKNQADKLIHATSSLYNSEIDSLANTLVELSPENLTRVHPKVSSGSAANEGAIKMAQRATGARQVISTFRAHLGQTIAMTSLSGNAFRKRHQLGMPTLGVQVPDAYCMRCFYNQNPETCDALCADRIYDFHEFATMGDVAAVIVEPISGNGGNIIPPKGYFKKLQQVCKDIGAKLIFDEIQTGIGRTGYMFAAEYFEVNPDLMTVAKGLGGSGAQVAAILASEECSGLKADEHSFTYGSNILAAAAANATLEIVRQPEFLENVRQTGDYIKNRLSASIGDLPNIFDVRGLGLMIGIEVVKPHSNEPDVDLTNTIAKRATEYGLMVRTSRYGNGNVLKIRPALNITMVEAEELCGRFERMVFGEC